MATPTRYTTDKGTFWEVRYRTPQGRQTRKRGFTTKRDAELWQASTEVKKATGEYVKPSHGRITVGELGAEMMARKQQSVKRNTYFTQEAVWRVHVLPYWGHTPVAAVDTLDVETWLASLTRGGLSMGSAAKCHSLLKQVLEDAVKGKRIVVNPVVGVRNRPNPQSKHHVYLTADDVELLASCAPPHYRTLVLTLAYCGLRWSEASALRVRNVESLKGRLSIMLAAVSLPDGFVVDKPKGGKTRSVPVPKFVMAELSKHCIGRQSGDLVFPRMDRWTQEPAGDGNLFMHKAKGNGWFARAVAEAGVQKVTPHDLRHTTASLAVSAGANVLALSRMLGHEDPSMTLRTYADLFDTDLDAVAATMDARYAAAHADPRPRVDASVTALPAI